MPQSQTTPKAEPASPALLFPNRQRQPASRTTEEQAEESLREALGSPIMEEEILSARKAIADDRSQAVIKTPLSEQPRNAPSPPPSLLPSAVIGLHADARKEVRRAFNTAVKFAPGGSGRNANICACEKVDLTVLWKLDGGECRIDIVTVGTAS